MANNYDIRSLLTYHSLTAPLDPNPVTEMDIVINKLRLKYRTYIVELNLDRPAVHLPNMFAHDFGHQLGRYATLVDKRDNQFEVLVERNNTGIYLTKGFLALRDFYKVKLGAWVTLVYLGLSTFQIRLRDRFGRRLRLPKFSPSMKFEIDRFMLPNLPPNFVPLPFVYDQLNFQFSYEKVLDGDELDSGWLTLAYGGFCQLTLDKYATSLKMVDECGNKWMCILAYGRQPYEHFKIGGGWKRMVDASGISKGAHIMVGTPAAGDNRTVYFRVINN